MASDHEVTPAERRARIVSQLATSERLPLQTGRLGDVCASVTQMSGAGIMLLSDEGHRVSLCTTDATSETIERLQFELGEGPCLDAFNLDEPVLEPDLANPAATRWLLFSAAAVKVGARAVFGFPMRVGAVRLGALNLYRDRPGVLSDDQHDDALAMADVAASSVLALQASAPDGELAGELDASANFQLVVHQAAGIVSAQLDIPVSDALARLRAHAIGEGRPLRDLARDVVARRLRFEPDPSP